jgi:lysophospholipase L1-like esterase
MSRVAADASWVVDDNGIVIGQRLANGVVVAAHVDRSYTAAQLTAMAAAGRLTPYATHVASGSKASVLAARANALVAPTRLSRSTVMLLGDSLQAASLPVPLPIQDPYTPYGVPTLSLPSIGATFVRLASNDPACPTGAGTLRYYNVTKEFSWQAFGQSEGARVAAPTAGFYKLESSAAGAALYIAIADTPRPVANVSDTVTIAASRLHYTLDIKGFFAAAFAELNYPFDLIYNYGISGITATDVAAMEWQWGQVWSDVTVINAGTNETSTIAIATTALTAMRSIIMSRIAMGSQVIVVGLFPADGSTTTVAGAKAWFQVQLAALCTELDVTFVDALPYVSDPSSTSGAWATTYSEDGLHPSVTGALQIARRALTPALTKFVQSRAAGQEDSGISWDSSLAPYGNTLTNGRLTGTAGAKGSRVTGTVPTSWNVSPTSGSVIACACTAPDDGSPVARTDGKPGNWFQLVINNTGGVLNETIRAEHTSYIAADRYAVGDYMVAECDLEISGSGFKSVTIAGAILPNHSQYAFISQASALAGTYNGQTVAVRVRSRPMKLVETPTNGNLSLTVVMQANGVGTVKLARVSYHKVPAPV